MPQRRMIYEGIYANSDLNMLSIEARHLYIGTIVLADDDGKSIADPRWLKGRLFSCDDQIGSTEVQKMLEKLSGISQIILYKIKGRQYLKHPKWKQYQRIRKDLHRYSTVPNPLRDRYESVTEPLLKISKDKLNKVKLREEGNAPQSVAPSPKEIAIRFFSPDSKQDQEKIIQFLVTEKSVPADVARVEITKFVEYWTELSPSGKKRRWEGEKYFDLKRRLATWFRNYHKFSGAKIRQNKIVIA